MTAGGGWLGTVIAGLFAGKSDSTGSASEKSTLTKVKEVVAAVAPFLFIAGLLIGVAYALHQVVADQRGRGLDQRAGQRAGPAARRRRS